jgi:hypothetical protein
VAGAAAGAAAAAVTKYKQRLIKGKRYLLDFNIEIFDIIVCGH